MNKKISHNRGDHLKRLCINKSILTNILTNMHTLAQKFFILILLLSFSFARTACAQQTGADTAATLQEVAASTESTASEGSVTASSLEESSTAPSTENEGVSETAPVNEPEIPVSDVSETVTATVVQDAASVQEGVTSTLLENTSNPETATSTDTEVVSVAPAESTPQVTIVAEDTSSSTVSGETSSEMSTSNRDETVIIADTPLLEVVDSEVSVDIPQEQIVSVVETPTVASVASIPLVDVQKSVGPEFEFALTGKNIPTEREDKKVTTALAPAVDAAAGTMQISGHCSSDYYVVLLFRHQDDYKNDPRSYVVNRAYPCEGGSFSYAISDLPDGLQDGIYYLMIGEQGKKGPWTPITALTEITIKKN